MNELLKKAGFSANDLMFVNVEFRQSQVYVELASLADGNYQTYEQEVTKEEYENVAVFVYDLVYRSKATIRPRLVFPGWTACMIAEEK